ncbi:uncharacterized protein LOC106449367 [Brassica napus]|uniref:uncharacterized protein LOC106449367 n=1 Tax=Brassica napus TaxID=3708 RepID=UPI0006AAB7EE|nr:uncharacterized protein LOC106449367 [Brassica napus]
MVFVEGSRESVQGALSVFEEFEAWSGLSISLEKSTIYIAGVSVEEKRSILTNFKFAEGELPVRKCIKEIEQMCPAFLWTGPLLKNTNAKVAWKEICKAKSEGGLGIRDLGK